jgi:hypothetical protein
MCHSRLSVYFLLQLMTLYTANLFCHNENVWLVNSDKFVDLYTCDICKLIMGIFHYNQKDCIKVDHIMIGNIHLIIRIVILTIIDLDLVFLF